MRLSQSPSFRRLALARCAIFFLILSTVGGAGSGSPVPRTALSGCGAVFNQPSGSPVAVGTNPESVAVGDFNHDGKPDLAVANFNSNNVTILLGDGSGGFSQPSGSPVAVGLAPFSVAVGDFNHDGKPDLAVANEGSNNVTIQLGDGTGG